MSKRLLYGLAAVLLGAVGLAVAGWDSSGNRSNPAPPIQRRPPVATKPSRLSDDEAEYLLRRILSRIQDDYRRTFKGGGCGTRGPWLSEDRHGNGPKARLFARAYPETAKRMILEVLEDPEAPAPDRGFALQILGSLEDWNPDRLQELLRSLVESGEDYARYTPLRELARRDPGLRHIDLYHDECWRGNSAAFEVLSTTFQRTTFPLFEKLALQSRNRYWPLGGIPDRAEDGLRQLKILQSDRWKQTVEAMLCGPTPGRDYYEDQTDFHWAYEAARRRGLPTLVEWLGKRARSAPADGRDQSDVTDIALVLFALHGGALTPQEFARLRPNGFVGDAEERLLEIVAEERIR